MHLKALELGWMEHGASRQAICRSLSLTAALQVAQ